MPLSLTTGTFDRFASMNSGSESSSFLRSGTIENFVMRRKGDLNGLPDGLIRSSPSARRSSRYFISPSSAYLFMHTSFSFASSSIHISIDTWLRYLKAAYVASAPTSTPTTATSASESLTALATVGFCQSFGRVCPELRSGISKRGGSPQSIGMCSCGWLPTKTSRPRNGRTSSGSECRTFSIS